MITGHLRAPGHTFLFTEKGLRYAGSDGHICGQVPAEEADVARLWDALMRLDDRLLYDTEGRLRRRSFALTRTAAVISILVLVAGLILIIGRVLWWTEPTAGPGSLWVGAGLFGLLRWTLAHRRKQHPRTSTPGCAATSIVHPPL